MATEEPTVIISSEVEEVLNLEKSLAESEAALMTDDRFRRFLTLQKESQAQIAATWKKVEEQMIAHDVKSIKGDWGSITLAERIGWDIDMDTLPLKFIKKVADTTKITDSFRLEDKPPRGCTPKYTRYLTKRIK